MHRLRNQTKNLPKIKNLQNQQREPKRCTFMPTTTTDSLFEHCEELQGDKPWGTILDSGTGSHSLRWLNSLANNDEVECDGWVAITADEDMRRRTQEEVDSWGAGAGKVIIGNWAGGYDCNDESVEPESNCNTPPKPAPVPKDLASLNLVINKTHNLLRNQKFQTILCDYLIGAMDGFSPFFQDLIFPRLRNHLLPGGRVYVIGLQPIPDTVNGAAGEIFCKVTKIRDACILLAGESLR